MTEGVKNALITGIFTLVGAVLGAGATYYFNAGDDVISKEKYQNLKNDYDLLKEENNYLSVMIEQEKQNGMEDLVENTKKEENLKEVWLENLTPLSSISIGTGNGLEKSDISCKKWTNEKDNGGNSYNHGIYVGDSYNALVYSSVTVTYNLEGKYSNIEGTIVLSEQGKNQSGEARLKIIADEDISNPKYVTVNNVSPGFLPETFNIDVRGVKKLEFILEEVDSDGYWSRDFGIVNARLQ